MNNSKDEMLIKKLLREMILAEGRDDGAVTNLTRWAADRVREYLETRVPGSVDNKIYTLDSKTDDIVASLPDVDHFRLDILTQLGSDRSRSGGSFNTKRNKNRWFFLKPKKSHKTNIIINIEIGENFKINKTFMKNGKKQSIMGYLVASLKGTIAHEVHHSYQFNRNEDMTYDEGTYIREIDPKTGEITRTKDKKSVGGIMAYFGSKVEIEAYAAGIRKRAKHENIPFEQALREFCTDIYKKKRRLFSGRDRDTLKYFIYNVFEKDVQAYYDKRYPKSRIKPTEEVK